MAIEWTPTLIRSGRQKRGMTMQALADAVGVSQNAVSKWEAGLAKPTYAHARRLEQVLRGNPHESNPVDELGHATMQIRRLRQDVDQLQGVVRSLIVHLRTRYGEELDDLPPVDGE